MKFTKLEIAPFGDGVTYLYLDGKLITSGDEYHDSINTYIDGYVDAYKTLVKDVEVENIAFEKEEWIYDDFSAEPTLKKLIKKLEKTGFIRVEDE